MFTAWDSIPSHSPLSSLLGGILHGKPCGDLNPLLGIGSEESSLQREDFYTEIYNLIQENAFISVQTIFCTYVM